MSRLDGKFIKPGTITQDRLDPEIPLGGDIPPGTVTAEMLGAALLEKFVVASWGEPVVLDPTTRTIVLQLVDLAGDPVEAAHIVRVTCDSQADLAVGDVGTALAGDGTEDLIAQTDAAGAMQLVVTCEAEVVISVAAGPTQSSPMLDCRAGVDVSFNP
jgi:hypothetical protein